MAFKDRLKKARIKKGLKQVELSAILGLSKGVVSNYEAGVSYPNIEVLYKLIEILNVEPNYLFWDELPNKLKIKILKEQRLNQKEKDLVNAYRKKQELQGAVDKLLDIKTVQEEISESEEQEEPKPRKRMPGVYTMEDSEDFVKYGLEKAIACHLDVPHAEIELDENIVKIGKKRKNTLPPLDEIDENIVKIGRKKEEDKE